MARITVEDCLAQVDNRFELVLRATRRARQLANGAESLVPFNNDKPTVVALRELAQGLIGADFFDVPVEPEINEEFLESAGEIPTGE